MDAPRQKLMKDNATVVATTTLAVLVVGLLTSDAISGTSSDTASLLGPRFYPTMITWVSARPSRSPPSFAGAGFRLGWWGAQCAIWFWGANRRTTIFQRMHGPISYW